MRGKYNRHSFFFVEHIYELPHRLPELYVNSCCWLIKYKYFRFVYECPCYHETTFHSSREFTSLWILLVPKLKLFEIVLNAFSCEFFWNPIKSSLKHTNIINLCEYIKIKFLWHYSNILFCSRKIFIYIYSSYLYEPRIFIYKTCHYTNRGWLPCPVMTEQREKISLLHTQINRFENF